MLIQINTDKNIEGTKEMIAHFSGVLQEQLGRFDEEVTRLEVHLSDENADKDKGDDKRCALEARLNGADPLFVDTVSDSLHKSVKSASEKMFLLLDKMLEKRRVQG